VPLIFVLFVTNCNGMMLPVLNSRKFISSLLIAGMGLVSLISCQGESPTPKPEGYPRIQLPERSYQTYDSACPYRFQYPTYLGARLYLSYRSFNNLEKLQTYREDARTFAYKHTVKASRIEERRIRRDSVSGIFYELGGNTATALQFYVTDSNRHFMRGSLYFNTKPNRDSLRPAIQFLKKDMLKMIRTLEWQAMPEGRTALK
jgi:hypothetical protein